MPRKKKPEQARCERCFQLFAPADLCTDGADVTCVDCLDKAPVAVEAPAPVQNATQSATDANAAPVQAAPAIETHGRCERCMRLRALVAMHYVNDDHVCEKCLQSTDKHWYAIALVGSESKVTKAIRDRATKYHVRHMLGKIISPKMKVATSSRTTWEAITSDGQVLGTVTADDYETAMYEARNKFEPRSQKGVFKPDREDIFLPVLTHVVRTIQFERVNGKRTKKTVYEAFAEEKLLGRISGAKSPKHAAEIAERLYGEKEKPRAPVVVQGYVETVRKTKEGGVKRVTNRKSMKGYLLVQCQKNDHIFSVLKETPGVYSVLPFTERVSFEQIERDGLPDYPSSLSYEEEQRLTVDPKKKIPSQNYQVGDQIDIVSGIFGGQSSRVERVLEDDRVTCYATMLGKKISVAVHFAEIRKS